MAHVTGREQPKKRRRNPKDTRARLVRAAVELFTTIGYHSATTPQIAQKAGVAEGTIYRHFKSKEDLLNETYRAAVDRLIEPLKDVGRFGNCRERLHGVALEWRAVSVADPAVTKLIFSDRFDGPLNRDSKLTWERFKTVLATVIASGKSAGEVRPGPAEVWAEVWLQLVSFSLLQIARGVWTPEQAAPNHVLEAAWDAIANRG